MRLKGLGIYIMCALMLCATDALAQRSENHNSVISRNLELFNDIYKQLDLFYVDSLNADTVIGWGIRSMLRQVDPFTDYYPEDDDDLRQMATGKYAGIGSVIRFHIKEDRVMIAAPYEGSPSEQAGLRAGDMIMSIDGKDVKGMMTPEVSNMLRGEAGTTFELVVRRDSTDISKKITRRTIQVPQVPYYGMIAKDVGYVCLTGFTQGVSREVGQALGELKSKGAKKLVFDLRENGGGAVNEAIDISNLFIPKGKKVMYTRGKMAHMNREYYTAGEPMDTLMPVVVLVDGGTASSSEIVAGCLQDMDRAVIMGVRTYGKGMVQTVREVPYNGNLKITTGRYYIPSGRCIQAYDYRHLNKDGMAGTMPDSLTKVFHTAGGREVRDGGGVKPDVEVKADSLPTLVYDLVQSDEFFDFATRYTRSHKQIDKPDKFALTDDEYAEFVEYIKGSGFRYDRRTGEVLKLLRKVAEREGCLENAKPELEALEAKMEIDLSADLNRFRSQIVPYLEMEIVQRYYYQSGMVEQQLRTDPCVARALEVLGNEEEYRKILGK